MRLEQILLLLLIFIVIREFTTVTERFYHSDPYLEELHAKLSVIDPALQNIQVFQGKESYTLNKSKVYICLFDKNGEYYPENMLVYVLCHEYAHVLCDVVDDKKTRHSKEFFVIFNRLLKKAEALGLHNPSIPPIDNYCMI